jgi:S1-C subfamily serine protease
MKRFDVIIKINDNYIRNTEDAELAVSDIAVGDKIKIVVLRRDKKLELVLNAVEYKDSFIRRPVF